MDFDQLGQAVVSLIILAGFVVQQWKARQRAEEVKLAASTEAKRVEARALEEAGKVAQRVTEAGNETRIALQEIHVMVDGRLDAALEEMHRLRDEIDGLKGDPPGTAAHDAGPAVLTDDIHP